MKGIDIYSEDNVYDWNRVKADGIQAVYIKATDGVTYINPKLGAQYNGAKSVGLLVGFYHFAERNNPIAEYQHFMSVINKYQQDLKPCLDYEVSNPNMSFVAQFMSQNSNLIYYGSHSTADRSGLPANRIWIAEPKTSPSNTRGYAGIQYSWTGRVNGITNSEVDLDIFSDAVLNNGVNAPQVININNNLGVDTMGVIKIGEQSNRVRLLQGILNVLLGTQLAEDGDFGNNTRNAVIRYQQIMGISADGIVGSQTANTLYSDIKNNWFKL